MNKSLSGTVSIFSLSPRQRPGISFIPFELIKLTDNKPSERENIYLSRSTLLIGFEHNFIEASRAILSSKRDYSLERNKS